MTDAATADGWSGSPADPAHPGDGAGPIGREAEAARILRRLAAAGGRPADGPPRALLVLGEPGTGRTHLLRFAEDAARGRGARVLSARGWGPEERQPFAVLHQLLLPVRDRLDGLPEPHRGALRAVLDPSAPDAAPADATGPQAPRLRLALLALVDRLARCGPVLLAVDDLQDCDRASLDALSFVARRLTDPAATVLLTAAGEAPPAGVPADLPSLTLGPLAPPAAARLLDAQPVAPAGRARLELLRRAEGHPLTIVELSRAYGAGGPAPAGGLRPGTWRIRQLYAERLAALPEPTRLALLYAAAAARQEELATVMAALGTGDLAVWGPAEQAGLVAVGNARVVFRSPLVRAAVLAGKPAGLRQQAYRALAAAVVDRPLRRAGYLAEAAVGPDEAVAAALERAVTVQPAGPDPAPDQPGGERFPVARAWEEAARRSPSDHDRARRLVGALTAAGDVGDPAWVRALYGEFTRVNRDPELLHVAACAMSGALSQQSYQREAFDLLLAVWQHTPPRRAATAFALASAATGIACRSGLPEHRHRLLPLLERAVHAARQEQAGPQPAVPPQAVPPQLVPPQVVRPAGEPGSTAGGPVDHAEPAELAHWAALVSAGADPAGRAVAALRGLAGASLAGPGRPGPLLAAAAVAHFADEPELSARQFRQAGELLRAQGAVGRRAWTLAAEADTLLALGRWAEADELVEEGRALAAVHRLTLLDLDLAALDATLRALRGDGAAERPLDAALHRHAVGLDENLVTRARMLRARALAATARGDADGAFRQLRALFAADGAPLDPFLAPRCVAELAAAAQRAGRSREAAAVVEEVRRGQGERPTTRMTLLLHHAAALLDEADPERYFRLAVVNPEGDTWPLERAQARLHYAIWLRRRRRPLEARTQLTVALETAERLGARPLAEAAGGELRASGVAHAPASSDALAELTAQQQQIARLAASGLSNREIGEQLFLSPRTVGSHLYNVYPKLGISSRHQLRDLVHG